MVCSATTQPVITAAYKQLAPALKPLLSAIAEVQQRRALFCFGIAMHPFVGASRNGIICTLAADGLCVFNHLTEIGGYCGSIYLSNSAGYVNPACPSGGNIPFPELRPA
jgi:hypothetical protein